MPEDIMAKQTAVQEQLAGHAEPQVPLSGGESSQGLGFRLGV